MANNYTQFAAIVNFDKKAARYVQDLVAALNLLTESEAANDWEWDYDADTRADWVAECVRSLLEDKKFMASLKADVSDDSFLDIQTLLTDITSIAADTGDLYSSVACDFELIDDDRNPARNGLYLASDESGDIELVANLLQSAMVKFNINEPVGLEFACTCSKMRADEFGGGAVVIAKDGQYWMNTSTFVQEKIRELNKAKTAEASVNGPTPGM